MLGLRILLLWEYGHATAGNDGVAVLRVCTCDANRVDQFNFGAIRVDLATLAGDVPGKFGAAIQVQVRIGQQADFGSLQVLDLVRCHLILHLAVRQVLNAVGIGGVIVDKTFVNLRNRLVEKALRADIPVAHRQEQRGDDPE